MQKIIHGDCLEKMKQMEDNSIDFVVTDPPYGFKFMNKKWDYQVPSVKCWKEVLRIIKPGSWIAVFGGTRTYHRMVLNVEDAGFEIRDCINWLYGSGFPKSHNISKAIDKEKGLEREIIGKNPRHGGGNSQIIKGDYSPLISAPNSPLAKQFDGYGTALKPAHELILIAMKPLDGTFAQNAEKWGVAGINIDNSRIGLNGASKRSNQADYPKNEDGTEDRSQHWARTGHNIEEVNKGRWPANLIFNEEAAEELDQMMGVLKSGGGDKHNRKPSSFNASTDWEKFKGTSIGGDSGGPSRYFYCAKASSSERNRGLDKPCSHPTVKPISLMKYIIKLLAPPGNPICLDMFMGSGSTLVAAKELGISAIGIEKEKEYVDIATKRIDAAQCSLQMEMFNGN